MKGKCNRQGGISRREILRYGLSGGVAAGLPGSLFLSGCSKLSGGSKRPNVVLIVL